MPSPVYQNMVNFILSLSIRRCPSKFMNIAIWERCSFEIFRYGKIYYLDFIIIINFVYTLILNCWFENSSVPAMAMKFPIKICM
jgi:hypothetical protein